MKVYCPILAVIAVALWGALVGTTVVENNPKAANVAHEYLAAK